jgi:hypothetical protein
MPATTISRFADLVLTIALITGLAACGGGMGGAPAADNAAGAGGAAVSASGETDYRATVSRQYNDIQQSVDRFGSLMARSKITDLDWRTEAHLQLATWRDTHREAQQLTPPPELEEFHRTYLEGLAKFDSAADDVSSALDNPDVARFHAAATKMTDGVQLIQEVMPLLQKG